VRERCEQDREQADCEYGAGGEQSLSASHPRHHPCRRYLRYDDDSFRNCECAGVPSGALVRLVPVLSVCDSILE